MANETSNYPDFVFVAYDEDFSAQTHDVAVSLEPGSLVGVPVKYVRHDLNTRPAAPVEGLETVAYFRSNGDVVKFRDGWLFDDTDPLVTRSQSETIIAAERAEKERLAALLHKNGTPRFNAVCERAERAEADNAALTEQVKELEETKDVIAADKKTLLDLAATNGDKVTALETQLAAVKEAAAQAAYRACAETRHFKLGEKAATAVRAALEGQP